MKEEKIRQIQGKYAYVKTSVDEFLRIKHEELKKEEEIEDKKRKLEWGNGRRFRR